MLVKGVVGGVVMLAACASVVPVLAAEAFVESSAETRMQLDLAVSSAALKKFLPDGWDPVVATSGAAKDCNVRLIFIDRVDINGPDNAPVGSNQLVFFAVPIKKTGTDTAGQMIIHGLTADPKDVPGPFGVYEAATSYRMDRSIYAATGQPIQNEDTWQFTAASGEHLELHLTYERGVARKIESGVRFFSGKDPNVFQVTKLDQGLDIMRNATITVKDRVKDFQLKASGGTIAPLFDGTERVVSVDAIHWYNRGIWLP